MTEADWKKAEDALGNIYGHVNLLIDGYNVTVEYAKASNMKYDLVVFIDGVFKMKWCLEDCDIRRRFCRLVKKRTGTRKSREEFIKAVGKRAAAKFEKENEDLLCMKYYVPWFGSFRTLKSHLIKNNTSIELAEKQ